MARVTVVLDADMLDPLNTYPDGSHIGDSIQAGIAPGTVVYVELSTGDVVRGKLVEVKATFGPQTTDLDEPAAGGDHLRPSCPRCGSGKWVSVSLDNGWTRRAQCVPCGAFHRPVIGPGWRSARWDDPDAEHPMYRRGRVGVGGAA